MLPPLNSSNPAKSASPFVAESPTKSPISRDSDARV
jgi:hypothetical protein